MDERAELQRTLSGSFRAQQLSFPPSIPTATHLPQLLRPDPWLDQADLIQICLLIRGEKIEKVDVERSFFEVSAQPLLFLLPPSHSRIPATALDLFEYPLDVLEIHETLMESSSIQDLNPGG